MSDVQAGKYTAKILDYGIGITKAGDPTVVVRFGFGQGQSLIWNGSLKEGKAQEITIKALLTLGLSNEDNLEALADGIDSNLLDINREVEIDVQPDTYEGKTRMRIAWINPLGGSTFRNAMSKNEFKIKLGGMNLKAAVKAAKLERGITDSIKDIPF